MSLNSVKAITNAIIKVTRVNNTLQFVSANQPTIPYKVIVLNNLKSVTTYHCDYENKYTLLFNYLRVNDSVGDDCDRVFLQYKINTFEWKAETEKIINETMRLV